MITGITSSTEESDSNTNTTTSIKKDTADGATTSHASEKKTVEQVGSNRISLSGKRLRLIAESNPNYVPFTYDNITLEIPTEYLLSLNLKDNEVLMVSIVPGSGKEVTVAVRAAGKVLTAGSHGSRRTKRAPLTKPAFTSHPALPNKIFRSKKIACRIL